MKPNFILSFLALMSCAFSVQPAKAATHHHGSGARLIVQRAANFGNDLVVHLAIDGRDVANIARAHRFEGYVSAGRHTLTISPLPNPQQIPPTSIRMTFRSQRTYIYSAGWGSRQLVLIPTSDNIPAMPAPRIR